MMEELEVVMPCDATNVMLGVKGAAYTFGPQKGARAEDLQRLDKNMEYTIRKYLEAINPTRSEEEIGELL